MAIIVDRPKNQPNIIGYSRDYSNGYKALDFLWIISERAGFI